MVPLWHGTYLSQRHGMVPLLTLYGMLGIRKMVSILWCTTMAWYHYMPYSSTGNTIDMEDKNGKVSLSCNFHSDVMPYVNYEVPSVSKVI